MPAVNQAELSGQERAKLAPILFHPYTLGLVLYSIAIRLYGETEVHTWEPETLALEFKDDFGQEMPPSNQDKLAALIAAVTAPGFYHDWSAFMQLSQLLNNGEADGSDPILVAEMCWAVIEVKLCDDQPHHFSEEVSTFVGKILDEEGFVHPPPPLKFARLPERYHGSDTSADEGKAQEISSEHEEVARRYVQEQSLTLLRQIRALPWHTDETIAKLTQELKGLAG